MRKYTEACTKMVQDIAEALDRFYFGGVPKVERQAYVYVDVEKSSAEYIAFGVVATGVEDFGNEKYRKELKEFLIKEFGLCVGVPRICWGRVVNDMNTNVRNLYLFHIFIPAAFTRLKEDFLEE